ncbi:hypothetical protein [Dysgonomonas sp. Marseille-P4361]|uniref:hypothetical protein n=1 Tax=Dysgonomonas sp. Marseille-P4361 TaxID=2161820 RepID=UPI000D54D766|nr:hypothetical protein [Dysgonomonas sp. Marseille-P4361]
MGYLIKGFDKIATIEEPAQVSLSDNPNFITFSSKSGSGSQAVDNYIFTIHKNLAGNPNPKITFIEGTNASTGAIHEFEGTNSISDTSDTKFYVDTTSRGRTANNLRECLMKNSFFGRNFHISPPFEVNELAGGKSEIVLNENITLTPKGRGDLYKFLFTQKGDTNNILQLLHEPASGSTNADSISGGAKDCEIHLDIYTDNGVLLGEEDNPLPAFSDGEKPSYDAKKSKFGTYVTSMSKAYVGQPLWFNLNAVSSPSFSMPPTKVKEWANPHTIKDYRVIAKRIIGAADKKSNQDPFFLSNVYYQLTGYGRTLEKNDLTPYVFDTSKSKILETDKEDKRNEKKIKLLTTQPELTHTAGQLQYLNFILSDPNRNTEESWKLGLLYKFYASHGRPIDEVTENLILPQKLNMVNTIRLNLDTLLAARPAAARVEVCLCQYEEGERYMEEPTIYEVSHPLSFRVMPECLYKVHDFIFLNRLGGWSSVNFSGTEKTDFKTKATTFYQTHTPDKATSSRIENVFSKEVTESFTVETMPITREVCDWLKELSTSKAVYEVTDNEQLGKEFRYIIVDDMNIRHDTKDELFKMEMKYHYTDSYNARIE